MRNLTEHPVWHQEISGPPPCQGGRRQRAVQKSKEVDIDLFLVTRPTAVARSTITCPRWPCCGWTPLVRRCCQIFRLPRRTSIRHIGPSSSSAQECVESESRDPIRGKQLHLRRERGEGGGLTLNMLLQRKRDIIGVYCLYIIVDTNPVPPGGSQLTI